MDLDSLIEAIEGKAVLREGPKKGWVLFYALHLNGVGTGASRENLLTIAYVYSRNKNIYLALLIACPLECSSQARPGYFDPLSSDSQSQVSGA
jgi:hypothetical protein